MTKSKSNLHKSTRRPFEVKLGAQSKHFQMLRVDARTVAFGYGEREIRIWDLEAEDSAILRLSADRGYEASDEQVLMLGYNPKKGP